MKKFLLSILALGTIAAAQAGTGTAADPYTVDEFIEHTDLAEVVEGVYVTGYIVGCVDGASIETGAQWKAPFTSETNILLAGSSSEDDVTACVPVQLPSSYRATYGLVASPENLGHQITIGGTQQKYFTVPGLKSPTSFKWVGEAPVKPEQPAPSVEETGTPTAPLTVADVIALGAPATAVAPCYVKGYIVGFLGGKTFENGTFSADGAVASNIILAPAADVTDLSKCIPVALASGSDARAALNLIDNPGNIGKEVLLEASREKYFGVPGLKSITNYSFDGTLVIPEPAAYTALVDNADGWTFENITLPAEMTYIWKWDTYNNNGYLKASGYFNSTNYDTEANAISPVIDLTEYTGLSMSFEHAAKFQDTIKELCYPMVREEGATEWTALQVPEWPVAGGWAFVNSGEIDLSAFDGKKIQIAFHYGGNTTGANTWEVNKLVVNGTNGSGVAEVEADNTVIYGTFGAVVAPENAKVFNLQGVQTGAANLPAGIYVVVAGKTVRKVIVK